MRSRVPLDTHVFRKKPDDFILRHLFRIERPEDMRGVDHYRLHCRSPTESEIPYTDKDQH